MNPELKADNMPVSCFAPVLTDELIEQYDKIIEALPNDRAELRDAMRTCLRPVREWWRLPESSNSVGDRLLNVKHRGKGILVRIVPLASEYVQQLHDAVPWHYELDAIQSLFDKIPVEEKSLRDAAFHLLWHCRELCHDREPLTQDKLV